MYGTLEGHKGNESFEHCDWYEGLRPTTITTATQTILDQIDFELKQQKPPFPLSHLFWCCLSGPRKHTHTQQKKINRKPLSPKHQYNRNQTLFGDVFFLIMPPNKENSRETAKEIIRESLLYISFEANRTTPHLHEDLCTIFIMCLNLWIESSANIIFYCW